MTDKKLQELIEEAKASLKEYPGTDVFALATEGDVWRTLSQKQKTLVKRALMPCGELVSRNAS